MIIIDYQLYVQGAANSGDAEAQIEVDVLTAVVAAI